jgi:hypothetical protein
MDDLVRRLDGLSNHLANRSMFNSVRLVIDAAQSIATLTKERDEARAALATARRDALEEAAKVAEEIIARHHRDYATSSVTIIGDIPHSIRALQENTNGQ